MSGNYRTSFDDTSNAAETEILGGTDQTKVGNLGDRLKVQTTLSPVPSGTVAYFSEALIGTGGSVLLNVNGATTPVTFSYTPSSGQTSYVESIGLFLQDNGTTNATNFGSKTALTNGLLLESRINGVVYTVGNAKNNIDLVCIYPDNQRTPVTAGFLENGDIFYGELRFTTPLKLTNSTSDYIRITVRDNLSAVTALQARTRYWREV